MWRNHSDLVIEIVCDVHNARYTHRYPDGMIQLGGSCRSTITTTSLWCPRASESCDDTCAGNHSGLVIVSVCDVHIARYVYRYPGRIIQSSRSCRSTITTISLCSRACNGGDDVLYIRTIIIITTTRGK